MDNSNKATNDRKRSRPDDDGEEETKGPSLREQATAPSSALYSQRFMGQAAQLGMPVHQQLQVPMQIQSRHLLQGLQGLLQQQQQQQQSMATTGTGELR